MVTLSHSVSTGKTLAKLLIHLLQITDVCVGRKNLFYITSKSMEKFAISNRVIVYFSFWERSEIQCFIIWLGSQRCFELFSRWFKGRSIECFCKLKYFHLAWLETASFSKINETWWYKNILGKSAALYSNQSQRVMWPM